jgi:hypothetical protein
MFVVGLFIGVVYLIWFLIKKLLSINKHPSTEVLQQIEEQSIQSSPQFVTIGNLKIQCDDISYIITESEEKEKENGNGNPRNKVIHYKNSSKTDTVRSNFEDIIKNLPDHFFQIHKQYLINLNDIQTIDGDLIYLKGIKKTFYVSEKYKKDFNARMKKL